jgi:hypothetical protein
MFLESCQTSDEWSQVLQRMIKLLQGENQQENLKSEDS